MNKSKLYMLVSITVLAVTIIVSGATYAWYTWSTGTEDETKIVTNLGAATVFYDAGSNIEGISLKPVSSKENGIVKGITVKADRDTTYKLNFNLYLDVIELGDGLKDTSFKYALYKDSTVVKEGNFSSDYLTNNLITCTTNSTSHIILLSDETITSTTSSYTLYIWIDGTMDNPNTMQNQTFNFKLHADGGNAVLGETVIQKITNLYDNADKTTVTNNDITYNYASSVSLMNDRLGGTTAGLDAGNIRYYGASPNNYVDIGDVYEKDTTINNWEAFGVPFTESSECYAYFDCSTNYAGFGFEDEASCTAGLPTLLEERIGVSSVDDICGTTTIPKGTPKLYRIIGLFKNVELANGSKQDLVKVVRTESIGMYSWDTSDSAVNGGYGINEWSQADLMKLLNPGYESETIGGSLWWNSGSGTCYNDDGNATTSCDFTGKGLSTTVQNKIVSVVWNLGRHNTSEVYSNQIYGYERGTNVISNPRDGVTRTTSWTGKVALMYPSDYGYATDFNNCSSNLNNYSADVCYNNDWLYNNGVVQWLLTPHSSRAFSAWYVLNDGLSGSGVVSRGYAVRPVFYLNSELGIVSGNGSETNPYVVR